MKALPLISMGTWGLGAWGERNRAADERLCTLAYEAGIRLFETAPVYGDGYAECLLNVLPPDALIATKIPARHRGYDWRSAYELRWVLQHLKISLQRFGRNSIDLLQLHNWDYAWRNTASLFERLVQCREEGLVQQLGISLPRHPPPHEDCLGEILSSPIDTVQVHYNILDNHNRPVILAARAAGKRVLLRSVLKHGYIAVPGELYPATHPLHNWTDLRDAYLPRVRALGETPAQRIDVAIGDALTTGADSVIIGIRAEHHLENIRKWLH